jgi:5-methylcytosine-specific restriction endonuclease McrA
MEYRDYLQTEHWLNVRERVNEFWGRRCAVCNSPDNVQVHHRTYDHLGQERIQDVILLCDSCHTKFHGKSRYGLEPIQATLSRYVESLNHHG